MKRVLLRATLLLTLPTLWVSGVFPRESAAAAERRPNILLAIADDQSFPHAGAYGDRGVQTPAFDSVARNGVLFWNAFAGSPGCSPSRAALLTGRNTWELEQAGTHASSFPSEYTVYPDLLERAGYAVGYTGKGWGPGNYRVSGRPRNPAGPSFSQRKMKSPARISNTDYAGNFEAFLETVDDDQPFCFWYGAHEPHRSYKKGIGRESGKQLADARVPGFLPDVPEIRSDILDYYVEIEWFDMHLGRMLETLQERGQLDNTLVLVTADNGMPFPRAKANGYEYGIHVPLAVQWPDQVPGSRESHELIGFLDFAPTFLDAAGITVPESMSGRSFLSLLRGTTDRLAGRDFVFSARERHSSSRYNNWTYPIRSMRTTQYLYIRNFRPERWPAGHPAGFRDDAFGYYDIDGCPTKTFLIEHRNHPELARYFHLAVDKRPAEELYSVDDPANLHNLAEDPAHADVLEQLRAQAEAYLRQTGDPRILDGGDIYESYVRYSHMRSFPPPEED